MSNPKRIEELYEATNLHDNDLVFASVLNSRGTYDSKKVTLENIANYVKNGMEVIPGGSGFGGYEMIDTSESGNGIYTADTISQYTRDNSKNYLWTLSVGSATGAVTSLEKTVSQDCLVWISGIVNLTSQVKINDIELKMKCLWSSSANNYRFYLKSGQKLFVGSPTSGNIYVSIIPLKSGGKFYFDTSKPEKFYSGIVGPVNSPQTVANGDTNIFPGQAYMNNQSNKPTITVDCPTMFACTYWALPNITSSNDLLNGKKTWSDDVSSRVDSNAPSFFILDAGDTLTPLTTNPAQDQIQLDWIAYPLLMQDNGNGNGNVRGSGYEIYNVSDSNNDYIFNETISYVAPGSANYPTTYTHHFTHDCEILLGVNTISGPTNEDDYDYVKIDNMSIHPGLLAVGEQSNYGTTVNGSWYVAKFFVKSGQYLSLNLASHLNEGTQFLYYNMMVNSRPLKQGGDFFIDTSVPLSNPFTRYTKATGPFTFEAPRKTLFCWRNGGSQVSVGSGATGNDVNYWPLGNKVRLNGQPMTYHIQFKTNTAASSSAGSTQTVSWYNYDKLVLDKNDVLEFDISSSTIYYCALPLLDS